MTLHAVAHALGSGFALNGLYDFYRGISLVRGAGIYIKLGGIFGINGSKLNLLGAHSYV